jgi:PAS domain S-box-containing protein
MVTRKTLHRKWAIENNLRVLSKHLVVLVASLAFVIAHVVAILCKSAVASQALQVIAPLIAVAVSARASFETRVNKVFWRLVAAGFLAYTAGCIVTAYYVAYLGVNQPEPCVADVLYFVYGLPLVVAALHIKASGKWRLLSNMVDWSQLIIATILAYGVLYVFPQMIRVRQEIVNVQLVHFFNYENVFLVALYALAIVVERRSARLRATITLSPYLVAYAVCSFVANSAQLGVEAPLVGWLDLVWTVPFVVFWNTKLMRPERDCSGDESGELLSEVPNLTPALIPIVVLLLVLSIASLHPKTAVLTMGLSCILFGLRVMLTNREHRKEIAARTKAEMITQNLSRTYGTLLSNVPGCVYRCKNDRDWTAEFFTDGIFDITGFTKEELVHGLKFNDLIVADDREKLWEEVQLAITENRHYVLEFRILDKAGHVRSLWGKGCGIRNESGEVEALEGFITDITKEAALRIELQHAQRLDAVGRLAAGIAHDFNNMLMIVDSYATLIDANVANDKVKGYLKHMNAATERAANLTQQLLAFGKKQTLEYTRVELNAFISQTLTMLSRVLGEEIRITIDPHLKPLYVNADRGQLTQVILNLAVNSRDAMPNGGLLKVVLREENKRALISVLDSGTGIPENIMEHIFEPFFSTKSHERGTGLGLSTVYGIVKQSGGEISAENIPTGGTRFDIVLPVAEVIEIEPEKNPSVPREKTFGRILLVEDETAVRHAAAECLTDAGFTVISAANGAEALKIAECEGFHFLITDMVMPGMSGRELARTIKHKMPGIRVILMSGYAPDLDQCRGFELMKKPFALNELVNRVMCPA